MIDAEARSFAPTGVVEILDRAGRVRQRVSFSGGVLTIGRSYDNDVIVDDPYVCPHHLAIFEREGETVLRDLGSINGSYLAGRRERLVETRLDAANVVQFGHSQLRFRLSGAPVEAAWRDISRHGVLAWFDKPFAWLVAPLAALAAFTADSLQDMSHNPGVGELASGLIYPVLGMFLWGAGWAMVNRVVSHRANLLVHLAIGCTGLTVLYVAGEAVALAGFAFGLDRMVSLALLASQIAVAAVTVHAHLRYATHGRSSLQWGMAGLSALLLFGIPAVDDYLDRSEFDTVPYLEPLLKPPEFQVKSGVSPQRFFRDSGSLEPQLDADD